MLAWTYTALLYVAEGRFWEGLQWAAAHGTNSAEQHRDFQKYILMKAELHIGGKFAAVW